MHSIQTKVKPEKPVPHQDLQHKARTLQDLLFEIPQLEQLGRTGKDEIIKKVNWWLRDLAHEERMKAAAGRDPKIPRDVQSKAALEHFRRQSVIDEIIERLESESGKND